MTLTKKDLGQIRETVKETLVETISSKPVKKVIGDTVLEVMEPMMVATQKEFEKIDKRFDGVDEEFKKVGMEFGKIYKRFDAVDAEIKEKFDKIVTGQDKILKIVTDLRSDQAAGAETDKRHNKKLENHEARIVVIEKKLNIVKTF